MKNITRKLFTIAMLFLALHLNCQLKEGNLLNVTGDEVQALKDLLVEMQNQTDNPLFINHCKSVISVIDAQPFLSKSDISFLSATYDEFTKESDPANAQKLSSYLERRRTMVMAWQSPTDGQVSFSMLKLPKNWNPNTKYPVYIELHGLWNVADSPIEYMTYSFRNGPSSTYAFEDGYLLSPWGRGNLWYQGISETDIWEAKAELERLVKIDYQRQYLCGHSMGGYGAWYIASRSPETWAALGIHAGALSYDGESLLQDIVIQQLKDLPTYFVCGNNDGLLGVNQLAYSLISGAGNTHTDMVTFSGGHEYLSSNVENMYDWMREFENTDYANIESSKINKNFFCYPNPCKESVTFKFILEKSSNVKLAIYNTDGKLIETLINEALFLGFHEIKYMPALLNPGIYYCRLESDKMNQSEIISLVVL